MPCFSFWAHTMPTWRPRFNDIYIYIYMPIRFFITQVLIWLPLQQTFCTQTHNVDWWWLALVQLNFVFVLCVKFAFVVASVGFFVHSFGLFSHTYTAFYVGGPFNELLLFCFYLSLFPFAIHTRSRLSIICICHLTVVPLYVFICETVLMRAPHTYIITAVLFIKITVYLCSKSATLSIKVTVFPKYQHNILENFVREITQCAPIW